eukprot:446921-Amphidinium_carterae.1
MFHLSVVCFLAIGWFARSSQGFPGSLVVGHKVRWACCGGETAHWSSSEASPSSSPRSNNTSAARSSLLLVSFSNIQNDGMFRSAHSPIEF